MKKSSKKYRKRLPTTMDNMKSSIMYVIVMQEGE